jgi:CO dehydrogenase maturation factor
VFALERIQVIGR